VRVTLSDGIVRQARIVAIDRAKNLAILALDRPAPAAPLTVGPAPGLGEPLWLLARRWWPATDESREVLVPGAVIATSGDTLRSDAFDTRHETFGAPLLDCEGRLVAIANERFDDRALLLANGAALTETIGRAPEYSGDWSLGHPSIGGVFQADRTVPLIDRVGIGLSLGTALIGEDRWYFPFRLSLLAMAPFPVPEDSDVSHSGLRVQLEAGFGYRLMLADGEFPIYLTPTVGLAGGYDRWVEKIDRLVVTSSRCSVAEPCPTAHYLREEVLEIGWLKPTLGLALQLGAAEIGYQLQLDVDDPEHSTHQWFLGLQF
jgi:hypothetical protein